MNNRYLWKKKEKLSYLLAVLIMWSHCSCFTYYKNLPIEIEYFSIFFKRVINPVAVPLFFMISGALFYRDYSKEKYNTKIKSRINSLCLPFLCWNIINMLFHIFVSMFFSQYFNVREKFEVSVKNILLGIFHYEYNFPFWFLFALIIFSVAAPVINILIKNKYVGFIVVIVLIVLNYYEIGLPVPLFYNRTCIIYYLMGAIVGKHYFEILTRKANALELIISGLGIIASWIYEFIVHIELINGNEICNVLILILFGYSLWRMSDLFIDKLKEREYTKHSFWVYAMHINVSSIVAKLFYFAAPKNWFMAIPNFIVTTIISLFVIEVVSLIIKKISPKIYEILS